MPARAAVVSEEISKMEAHLRKVLEHGCWVGGSRVNVMVRVIHGLGW